MSVTLDHRDHIALQSLMAANESTAKVDEQLMIRVNEYVVHSKNVINTLSTENAAVKLELATSKSKHEAELATERAASKGWENLAAQRQQEINRLNREIAELKKPVQLNRSPSIQQQQLKKKVMCILK